MYKSRWHTSKKTEYKGILYDSKAEAELAEKLDKAGIPFLRQVEFLIPNMKGEMKLKYTADFVVSNHVLEVKGWMMYVEQFKYILFKQVHPAYTFDILWSADKKSKKTGKYLHKKLDIEFLLQEKKDVL